MRQAWLTQHLEDEGLIDIRGVGHTPRRGHCPRCGVVVLAAICCHGLSVTCWPQPTTPLGEYQATSVGLRTYTWRYDQALYYRPDYRIRSNNANQVPVVIEHRCEHNTPPISETHIPPHKRKNTYPERPPF